MASDAPNAPNAATGLPPSARLRQMINGYWLTPALGLVARLGIADLLRAGPQHSQALAAATGTHAPSLYRVLRALASHAVFAEDAEGRFHLTPLAEPLQTGVPGSVRAWAILLAEPWEWEPWAYLEHTVRTGETAFDHHYGTDWLTYLAAHADASAVFNEAMRAGSRHGTRAAAYDFSAFRRIVDVGGGTGALLAELLTAYPALHGIVFDLPHVVAGAAAVLEAAGVAERAEAIGGDFFAGVPSGCDAYLLSAILHDWDDEQSTTILRQCQRAMAADGRILVIETVVPPGNDPSPAKFTDVLMMVATGGKERTAAEFTTLFAAAGLDVTRIVPTTAGHSVIEGMRA